MAQLTESDIRRIIREELEAILRPKPVPPTALTSYRQRCNEALAREAQAKARKAGGDLKGKKGKQDRGDLCL